MGKERPLGYKQKNSEGEDDADGGDGPGKSKVFEESHDGSEEESQEDGNSKRKEENLREVEDGNGQELRW